MSKGLWQWCNGLWMLCVVQLSLLRTRLVFSSIGCHFSKACTCGGDGGVDFQSESLVSCLGLYVQEDLDICFDAKIVKIVDMMMRKYLESTGLLITMSNKKWLRSELCEPRVKNVSTQYLHNLAPHARNRSNSARTTSNISSFNPYCTDERPSPRETASRGVLHPTGYLRRDS